MIGRLAIEFHVDLLPKMNLSHFLTKGVLYHLKSAVWRTSFEMHEKQGYSSDFITQKLIVTMIIYDKLLSATAARNSSEG